MKFELNSKMLNDVKVEEGLDKIEELRDEYLKRICTNSTQFETLDEYENSCKFNSHSENGLLFATLMAYVHEINGLDGVVETINKILSDKEDIRISAMQEYEKFREKYPDQWEEFKKNKKYS